MRRFVQMAALAGAVFAHAGEWVTTLDGTRVCRLTGDLFYGLTLHSTFCAGWQVGFSTVQDGQMLPYSEQGWVRLRGNQVQIHVEDRWVP